MTESPSVGSSVSLSLSLSPAGGQPRARRPPRVVRQHKASEQQEKLSARVNGRAATRGNRRRDGGTDDDPLEGMFREAMIFRVSRGVVVQR